MVSLWDMLTLVTWASAFGASLAAAGKTRGVGAIIGIAFGFACASAQRTAGHYLRRRHNDETAIRLRHVGALAWVAVSAVPSFIITQAAINLVAH